jgi:tetratricopeptide (TPR) repeat protein
MVGVGVGVAGLGIAAVTYFFGGFAPTDIHDIRGARSCAGFLINDELPADAKPTKLDEDEIKRLKEKIECYRDQIEKNPNDAIAFTNRGEAKRRLGRLREALLDQKKALYLNHSSC